MNAQKQIDALERDWRVNPRWAGIQRAYSAKDVLALRGSVKIEHTLARLGAERLWTMLERGDCVRALGAQSGSQAVQMIQAGLQAIYVSGWQVAGDMNLAGETYPDQSLYPANSVPSLVRRINNALMRADQIDHLSQTHDVETWFAPLVADAEAGFGGVLNAYELMKNMIAAGAAGVHFEDQLSSAKKCGHMGGKVLVPTQEAEKKLIAARLAADVLDVPTMLIARTDANAANLITSDIDPRDHAFVTGERTAEGFFHVRAGLDQAIARALAYAPYADMIWCETARPDLGEAKRFAEAVHAVYPGKRLTYNCSPSFNWRQHLDESTIARFQRELSAMGYRFQFVTLAGFHALNASMFELSAEYREHGMLAYSKLQDHEFAMGDDRGYRATKHQAFVGAGYFDRVTQVIAGGQSSLAALVGSTEEEQFIASAPAPQALLQAQ